MSAIAFSLLAVHAAGAEPSGPDLCLELPAGHVTEDWAAAVEMAGMRLCDSGCEATAELEAVHGGLRLTVRTPEGAVLRPVDRFPVPRTGEEREELVWLVYSLLHPMEGFVLPLEVFTTETPFGPPADGPPGAGEIRPAVVPAPSPTRTPPDARPPPPIRDSPIPDSPPRSVGTPESSPDPPDRPLSESRIAAIVPPERLPPAVAPPSSPEPPSPTSPAPAAPSPAQSEGASAHRHVGFPALWAAGGAGFVSRGGVGDTLGYRATVGWASRGGRLRIGLAADLPDAWEVDVLGPTRTLHATDARAGAWWRTGGRVGAVVGGLAGLSWRTFTEGGTEVDARAIPTAGVEAGLSLALGSRWVVGIEPCLRLERDLAETDMTVDGEPVGSLDPLSRGVGLALFVLTP